MPVIVPPQFLVELRRHSLIKGHSAPQHRISSSLRLLHKESLRKRLFAVIRRRLLKIRCRGASFFWFDYIIFH